MKSDSRDSSSASSDESEQVVVPKEKPHPTFKSKSDVGSTKAIVPITSPKPAPAKRKLLKARSIALTQELMVRDSVQQISVCSNAPFSRFSLCHMHIGSEKEGG
jgi:hypothetical protein